MFVRDFAVCATYETKAVERRGSNLTDAMESRVRRDDQETSSDRVASRIAITIVTVTYARDHAVGATIARMAELAAGRSDVEYVLVDNNCDNIDRSWMLSDFRHPIYLKLGRNKGVSARSDGAAAARGDIILFVDDDTLIEPSDALSRYKEILCRDPGLAIVSARAVQASTGETPRAIFPHTDKRRSRDTAFETFRFQGTGFAIRREVYEAIGPMAQDIFFGLEEIDYAYRVIEAGYRIAYEPGIRAVEYNDPGGRRPKKAVEEMRLTNKMIISWKHMPLRYLAPNILMFMAYVFVLNGGRINPLRSTWRFIAWVRANPGMRRPIGSSAQAYIRRCGGHVWK